MELSFATVSCPVGNWTVEGDDLGVARIYMPHDIAPPASRRPSAVVTLAASQLDEYFRGRRTTFDITLADAKATPFQHDVWRVLQSLPYGSVATYSHVAQLAGRPRAARAVGNANHA